MKLALTALLLAFIMPTPSVLRRVAAGRDEIPIASVRAEGPATLAPLLAKELAPALGTQWMEGELALSAVLSVRFPGRCRLDLLAPDSTKKTSVVWNTGKRRTEGPEVPAVGVALEELCALLALKSGTDGESRQALERHLTASKVDVRQISLARFAGTVAYVVGDRGPRASSFWVYKDRFLPARMLLADATGTWDVRFIDYTSQATGEWLPRVLEVYRDDGLLVRMALLSGDTRASLDEVKF